MAESDQFYNDIIAEINPLFDEFGKVYSIRGVLEYDPDELEALPAPLRFVSGLVADESLARGLVRSADPVDASWVGARNLVLRNDANPSPTEEIEIDGFWYPLTKIKPVKPADIVVVYMMDVSR